MALRHGTGNRPEPRATARPGGAAYLIAHACFDCRKSWKVTPDRDAPCPECGHPLAEMGRSFRAPKKSDVEQWAKVRALWNNGFRFFSFRSYPDAEPLPERLRDVDDFTERNPDHPFRVVR